MKSENANNFEIQIKNLDLSLFSAISSQTSGADKTSLLSLQNAIRELIQGYVYLEIGSYLGGSIQTHLIDNLCSKIISIDKRPDMQPDERGLDYYYLNNLTSRMIQNLKNISEKSTNHRVDIDFERKAMQFMVSLLALHNVNSQNSGLLFGHLLSFRLEAFAFRSTIIRRMPSFS